MVITRNLQLTVKKNTRQQKTRECSLVVSKAGERSALSSRVAELDQIMPQNLGVSKAILDSVIFCHQDESLWPLSEPSALKKKFDEIFEALKYTKAIDNIKTLRKTQNDALKVLKNTEQYTKDIKDKGDRAEKRSKALSAELNFLKEEMAELHDKMKKAEEKWMQASKNGVQYTSVIKSLEHNRERESWLHTNVQELGRELKEQRKESDEWLQSELDQYDERMTAYEQQEKLQKEAFQNLALKTREIGEQLRRKDADAGKYQQQRADHVNQIKEREMMVKKFASDYKIRGYEKDLDDTQINECMGIISNLLENRNAAVDKARKDKDREKQNAQHVLKQLGEERSALTERKNSAKQESASNEREIVSLQADLDKIETDEGRKAIIEDDIKDLESRLCRSKDEWRKGSWDSKLQEEKSKLRTLQDKDARLREDLARVSKQAEGQAQLNIAKKEAADCQRNLQKMTGVYGDRLEAILGNGWQLSSLEADYRKINDERSRLVKDAEQEREKVSRRLEQLDFKFNSARSDRSKCEKELAACIRILCEKVEGEPEDYPKTLSAIQKDRDTLKADVDNYENERKYFMDGIALAHTDHKCKLCLRNFQIKEQTDFVSRLERKIAKQTMARICEDLSILEDDLRNIKEAGPTYETWARLSQEVPRILADERRIELERGNILREIEEHDKIVEDRGETRRQAESLANAVRSMSDFTRDLTKYSIRVEELAAEQKDTGISYTADEIQEQMRILGGKSRDMVAIIEKVGTEKQHMHLQIVNTELRLSEARSDLYTAQHQLDKKAGISKSIEDLKGLNVKSRDRVKQLDCQLKDLRPQIETEEAKVEEVDQRGTEKERDLRQEAARLSESIQELRLADQKVNAYIQKDGAAKLEQCQREIELAQRERDIVEEEKTHVTRMINQTQKELSNHSANKRTIADNIKYRRSLRDLQHTKTEIAQLSAQNAEADENHWRKESRYWESQHNIFKTQWSSKLGSSTAKDDELAILMNEWEVDYKDAAQNFKRAHIEVEVSRSLAQTASRW